MSNEELNWLASKIFSDEHYGPSLSEDELLKRTLLEEEYKDEISMAKLMLQYNPNFLDLPLENKLKVGGNLIVELREKREANSSKKM